MKAQDLANQCLNIAKNYKTVYMWGAIGFPVTNGAIDAKANQYPDWYTTARKNHFRSLVGKGYFGFDCVGMIKSILWGWNGNQGATYGGAKYASNGVPDLSANGTIKVCKNVSTNFTNIPIGAALWCEGHIGVYVGGGLGVECTPIWDNGVQITAVKNMGAKAGYHARQWTKWGLLPWVDYNIKQEIPAPNQNQGGKDLTREELFKITGTGDNPSSWHVQSTKWAKQMGLFKGDGNNDYGWQTPLTREQFAEVLYRFAQMIGKA